MAILEILKYPDPRLKQESVEVETFDDELQRFLDDLEETMGDGPGAVLVQRLLGRKYPRIRVLDQPTEAAGY